MKDRLPRALVVVFCITAICVLGSQEAAVARASTDCEQVRDPDQRHYCRACSTGQKSECEFIKDHDTRAKCRALCAK